MHRYLMLFPLLVSLGCGGQTPPTQPVAKKEPSSNASGTNAAPTAIPEEPEADDSPGINVGAQAPSFELPDQEGNNRSLSGLLAQGKVALVFYRSADW